MPDGRDVGYQMDVEAVELFMIHAGLNRASLAEAIDSSKGYVSDILGTKERPQPRRTPSEVMLKKIADALNVKPRMLLLRAVVANSVSDDREPGSTVPEQMASAGAATFELIGAVVIFFELLLLMTVLGIGVG